ncbi:T/G mismatch-specific endonuclease [Phyllobacterium sp. CL33Tsu]|uniref:very short patch repair endonuclease n=1 Tax=Phyllobacterium sp. CL33Tsu TaxID=1798191 RepID=UPI0008EC2952|nr:T/G mismatch-specific endonuclease [Phyllobacterium sp. CL33Tsu]
MAVVGPEAAPSQERSSLMAKVKGKNTKPEIRVRQILHRMGRRFRLHRRDLPGQPDIVLPKHKVAIFVHGCFWHRHPGCRLTTTPKTRVDFWQKKFDENVQRDRRNIADLGFAGWYPLVIWECETRDVDALAASLRQRLPQQDWAAGQAMAPFFSGCSNEHARDCTSSKCVPVLDKKPASASESVPLER